MSANLGKMTVAPTTMPATIPASTFTWSVARLHSPEWKQGIRHVGIIEASDLPNGFYIDGALCFLVEGRRETKRFVFTRHEKSPEGEIEAGIFTSVDAARAIEIRIYND